MKKITRFALLIVCLVFSTALAGCGDSSETSEKKLPSEWFYCAQDKDCTIIDGTCGAPIGVNSEFKSPAAQHYRTETTSASCGAPPAKQETNVQCIYHETGCQTITGGMDHSKKCMSAHKECVVFVQTPL